MRRRLNGKKERAPQKGRRGELSHQYEQDRDGERSGVGESTRGIRFKHLIEEASGPRYF